MDFNKNTTPNNSISNSNINNKYKTSRCRHFEQHGNCQMGDKCHFAHGDNELRSPNDPLSEAQIELASQKHVTFQKPQHNKYKGGPSQQQQQPQINNFYKPPGYGMVPNFQNNFKTVKCKFFENDKNCPYGVKCTFAHGDTELRMSSQMPMQMFPTQMYPPPPIYDPNYMMPMVPMDPVMMNPYMTPPPVMDYNQQMMYGGMSVFPPTAGMQMMTPNYPQDQQITQMMLPSPTQKRLTFTTQEQDNEGRIVYKETNCDILIFDNSADVDSLIQKAGELINGGNNQEAMEILTKLVQESKIQVYSQPSNNQQDIQP